jgi:hypothetical protein
MMSLRCHHPIRMRSLLRTNDRAFVGWPQFLTKLCVLMKGNTSETHTMAHNRIWATEWYQACSNRSVLAPLYKTESRQVFLTFSTFYALYRHGYEFFYYETSTKVFSMLEFTKLIINFLHWMHILYFYKVYVEKC